MSMLICFARPTSSWYAPRFLFTEIKETLESIRKIIEGMTANTNINSKLPILVKPKVIEEPELNVVEDPEPEIEVEEPEPEVKEPEVKETHVDLLVEPTMKLVSSLIGISLRSPNIYDPLQIFV